ncbi:MAG: hypothetical protein K2O66_03040 [Bacteroidales bacterium]|nr:hypothetical protein [Bacteroidales bacterium]
MKKCMLLLTAILLVACDKPAEKESSRLLAQAVLEMRIESQNKEKAVEIVGDSVSVHRLSRYACLYFAIWRNFGPSYHVWDSVFNQQSFYRDMPGMFARDTLAHTFSFHSDYIIRWDQEVFEDGVYYQGVDGTEYLGWLTCSENVVFVAIYDTALKRYSDPYLYPEGFITNYSNQVYDTLGYVPNSLMRKNRAILQNMMDEKRFADMMDFYSSGAYTLYTCTAEEYRELVRLGLN